MTTAAAATAAVATVDVPALLAEETGAVAAEARCTAPTDAGGLHHC